MQLIRNIQQIKHIKNIMAENKKIYDKYIDAQQQQTAKQTI